jgi:hypothetical protein
MRPFVLAFLAGATSLALELVLVRLLAFFLTSAADFLAIPLALLGLALGSLLAHFAIRSPPEVVVSRATAAVLPVTAASLVSLFGVFDTFFHRVTVFRPSASGDALRLVVYSGLLTPPFVLFGILFAALFSANAQRLGRLYAADLAGAAFGCVLAPVLLTVSGLPAALVGVLTLAAALSVADEARSRRATLAAGALLVALAIGAATGVLFREHPEPQALAWSVVPHDKKPEPPVREVDVRWNEIARTALVRLDPRPKDQWGEPAGTRDFKWYVVQDNGLSNVTLTKWPLSPEVARSGFHSVPYRMGRAPSEVLVLFAGAGRDLMSFDVLSDGRAHAVGVEINGAVVEIGRAHV